MRDIESDGSVFDVDNGRWFGQIVEDFERDSFEYHTESDRPVSGFSFDIWLTCLRAVLCCLAWLPLFVIVIDEWITTEWWEDENWICIWFLCT